MPVLIYASEGDSPYDFFFLNHLLKNNHVCLLTFNREPDCVPAGVRVVRIPEPFHPSFPLLTGLYIYFGFLIRSIVLKHRANQIRHDVLINVGGLLYGLYSALSNCAPSVLLIWGSEVLVAPKFFLFRSLVKFSLKKADAVVVDSDVQEKACIALGCDSKKIVKFPWVDLQPILSRVSATRQRRNVGELEEKIGWQENCPVVISTRWHRPIYNVECLMQAIPRVVKEIPNARFLILGEGTLTETLRDNAAKMGVSAYVKFLGRVPFGEMPKYLMMADIYVSTSLSDGTSASLIEAMACKLPVIVTDIHGNREWVTNGSTGLLFPARDSEALADRIIRLSKDRNLRRALAEKAYQAVFEKANWKKNSELLDSLISSVARARN
jgi:glycosyltransferase involved in cell wall biosynthesis